MSSNSGLATSSGSVTNSSGFLAIIFHLFDLVDPDPVKDGCIRKRQTRFAKHTLIEVIVELLSLGAKPVDPTGLGLKTAPSKALRDGGISKETLTQPQITVDSMDVTELIKIQKRKARSRKCVDGFVKRQL
jgi:hypothetical protein